MEAVLTVTAKGQVTLRKDVLRHLGIVPGDKIEVALLPGGRAELRPAKPKPIGSFKDFFGCAHRPGSRPLSIEEMNEIIADGWAGIR